MDVRGSPERDYSVIPRYDGIINLRVGKTPNQNVFKQQVLHC